MTQIHPAIAPLASDPELIAACQALSPGDRSVVYSMLNNDDAGAIKTADSPCARLYLRAEQLGLMQRKPETENAEVNATLVAGGGKPMLAYALTDLGYRAIPVLLAHALPGADGVAVPL
jgi:hypothetical protein